MNIVGNRKLVVALAVLLLAVGAVLVKGDVPPGLVNIIEFLFPAFVAGNAIEHITNAVAASPAPSIEDAGSQTVHTAKLEGDIETLQSTSADIQQGVTTMNQAMALLIQRNQEYLQTQSNQASANRAAIAKAPYGP